jgi:hypothetical protein
VGRELGRWRIVDLLREALLNTFSLRVVSMALILMAVGSGVGCAIYMAAQWQVMQSALAQQERQGRSVIDFTSGDSRVVSRIDRSSCDRLSTTDGVRNAGAIEEAGRANFDLLGSGVQVQFASATLIGELGHFDAVVGSSLGFPAGTELLLTSDEFGSLDAIVGSPHEEALGVQTSVLMPLPPTDTQTESCTALVDQTSRAQSVIPALQSQLRSTGGGLMGTIRLRTGSDVVETYLNRPDRFVSVLAGAAGGLVAALRYRLAGGELAAYRFSGTSRRDLAKLLTFEQLLLCGVFVTSLCSASIVLGLTIGTPFLPLSWGGLAGLSWLSVFVIAGLPIAASNPIKLAKER